MSQGHLLNLKLQRIECDFNAVGLSDEPNDNCFYSFNREHVAQLAALVGARAVLYSYDSHTEVTACEALIETCRSGWRGEPECSFFFCGFRARPIEGSWYSGPVPWNDRNS
jgi:hypothetical protein